MINFGIYVNALSDPAVTKCICNEIQRGLDENLIIDGSIFYDQIGPLPEKLPCGLFHSSELWNFKGDLLVLSIHSASKVKNIVNDINLYLGYGWGEKNLLSTLKLLEDESIKTICFTNELAEDFYRITGKQSIGYSPNLENTINFILESKNE